MPSTEPEIWQILRIHLPSKRGIKEIECNVNYLETINFKWESDYKT